MKSSVNLADTMPPSLHLGSGQGCQAMPNLAFFAIENDILENMSFSYGKYFFAKKMPKIIILNTFPIKSEVFNYFNTHPIKNLI